jgi:PKD repeat protein
MVAFAGILGVVLAAQALFAGVASASPVLPYGVVSRFGGYEESGKELGKFVFPVGFAVAPGEGPNKGDAVYVMDRLSSGTEVSEGRLQYRLQKLSSTDTPLGSVVLPLQEFTDTGEFTNANPVISLAVDSHEHRVYALVEGMVNSGSGLSVPVAQRLVAWSTEPNDKQELVKAKGTGGEEYAEDPLTHAALIAGKGVLEPGEASQDLYAPEGIAVAPNGDVVIEAQEGVAEASGGPTVLQSVTTAAPEGELGEKWVAEAPLAPSNEQADGLFTTTGGFGVDLYEGPGKISRLAEVNSSLTAASRVAEDTSGGHNHDEAPTIDDRYTVNRDSNSGGVYSDQATVEPFAAGSPVAQLTNGLYAARYGHASAPGAEDVQSEALPWNEGSGALPELWTLGTPSDGEVGNVGIRLFEASAGPAKIVTTIGGEGPCKLETARLSVAAGSSESVFVLTEPNEENEYKGDEVIEFAPGGKGACPQASGQIEVNGVKTSSVTVSEGVPVQFDASSIDREGEAPYSFEWSFEGEPYAVGAEMTGPNYLWPGPEAEHTYESHGVYTANVRVNGDYGAGVFPVKVTVVATKGPVAKIEAPSVITAGQEATFSAAGSTATPGSSIVEYHWEFGDGTSVSTAEPQIKHTYANPGPETVKLEVTDAVPRTSEPATDNITVAAEEKQPEKQPVATEPAKTVTPIILTEKPPVSVLPTGTPAAAAVRIASTVSSAGAVTVTISCPTGNSMCAGTVTLQTLAKVASAHSKHSRLLLSTTSFDVAGGKQEVVHVHISAKGLALLRKAHSLRALATITTLAGSGRVQVTAHGDVTLHSQNGTHGH